MLVAMTEILEARFVIPLLLIETIMSLQLPKLLFVALGSERIISRLFPAASSELEPR